MNRIKRWGRRSALWSVLFLLPGLAVSSCAPSSNPEEGSWENFNIIWISFDSVRADHCSFNGYGRDTTPLLDEMADAGVNFTSCIAQAPYTLPSYSSMLTSLHVAGLSIRERENRSGDKVTISTEPALEEQNMLLSEVLKSNGYATAAFVQSWLSPGFGFDQGWDWYRHEHRPVKDSVEEATKWIGEHRDRPFFVFLYGTDTHYPFRRSTNGVGRYGGDDAGFNITLKTLQSFRKGELELGPEDIRNTMALYDEGLRQSDTDLAGLFDFLDQTGLAKNTIIVFNSDHGEEFNEHGFISHGQTYYQEVINTPLVIAAPGIPASGSSVDALVENIDIAPTLLEMVGLPPCADFRGQSLVPYLLHRGHRGDDLKEWAFSEGAWTLWVGAALHENKKLIFVNPNRKMLFDLANDPREQKDISSTNPDLLSSLEGALLEHLGVSQSDLHTLTEEQGIDHKSWMDKVMEVHKLRLDSATLEQLKALGYIE